MSQEAPGIVVVVRRIVALYFGDMVKLVIDVRRRVAAAGGELHADAEQVLLAQGSAQLEYTALINIRPSQGNRSMEIQDAETRRAVREITLALIGRGEELPQ